ncbi:MAG: BamA/TamA family outer membrane protein, partial [Chitinispirillaceae bacterium]|nr:BamA/TamA family outer membrane protein [Chitinispirillaceae bacterium]
MTRESTIRCYLRIDTGMAYDSGAVRAAKQRIMRTGLFSKTDIISVVKEYGCDLYVIVKEKGYLSVPLPGIYQYPRKYGKDKRWFFGDAGVDLNNFGGRMERLRVTARAWEWRTLGVGWTKPVLPTPYFFGIGVYADQRPDEFDAFDRTDLSGRLSFGADLYTHSRISFGISPMFRRADWHDGVETNDFYQAYGSIGWSTDRRETPFDPSRGWHVGLDTRSNYLYYDDNTPYVQQTGAFTFYIPGFFSSDKFACRFVAIVRD